MGDTILFLANCDGVQVFQKGKDQLWPILLLISDIKYRKIVIPVAFYLGKKKPKSAKDFLTDFVNEISTLIRQGVDIHGKVFKVKPPKFVCDTPARSFIKCTKGHTGFSSCEKCIIRGTTVEYQITKADGSITTIKENKREFSETHAELRTHDSFVQKLDPEHHSKNKTSPLLDILNFDIIKDVLLDPMHLFDIGCSKRLLEMITGKEKSKVTCIRGTELHKLKSIIETVVTPAVPVEFQRKHLDIEDISSWKATQFRLFMLYAAAIILQDFMEPISYHHMLKFIVSYRILSHPQWMNSRIDMAETFLIEFVENLTEIYGEGAVVMNFHNLIHVVQDAKEMNMPLIHWSAYPFENYMGTLKDLIRSSYEPLKQIVNRLSEGNWGQVVEMNKTISGVKFSSEITNEMVLIQEISVNGSTLMKKYPNSVIQLHSGTILLIKEIGILKDKMKKKKSIEHYSVKGHRIFTEDIFDNPCSSGKVGIWKITAISPEITTEILKNFQRKCIHLKRDNGDFLVSLLH